MQKPPFHSEEQKSKTPAKKTGWRFFRWFLLFCFFLLLFLLIPKTIKEPEVRGWAKPLIIPIETSSSEEKEQLRNLEESQSH